MYLGQDSLSLLRVQREIGGARQQHRDIGDRPVLLGQPGLGLPLLVRERVDVEGRRQTPLAVRHV